MGSKSKKRRKRSRTGRAVWMVLFLVSLSVLIFSVYNLAKIFLSYKEGTDEYDNLRQYAVSTDTAGAADKLDPADSSSAPADDTDAEESTPLTSKEIVPAPLTVDFASLQGINPDVKGWLYIEALDISYPIVQGENNDEYLHTTYEHKSNYAGSIFIDYQNSGDFSDCNTIVYGHNMKNLSMFGKLKQFKEQEKYKNSVYFWILTPEHDYRYQAFSAYYTEAVSDVYTLFSDTGELFSDYLEKMAGLSEVPLETPEFPEDSRIVTLSTCAGRNSSRRFVIQGLRLDN